jgi:hypothetical protein
MYNGYGNGNGDNDYRSGSSRSSRSSPGGIYVGGFYIKPLYLYIAGAVVFILAIYLLVRFLNAGLVMHFSLVAGALLLLANVRELIGRSYSRHQNTALLNVMIGAALVCAWLSQILGLLLWVPAVVLLAIAAPLAWGRAAIYQTYMQTARGAFNRLRQVAGSRRV